MRKVLLLGFVALAGCSAVLDNGASLEKTRDAGRLTSFMSDCDTVRMVKSTRIVYCGIMNSTTLEEFPIAQVRK